MPIYEYRCEKCEHQFDALQKISEDPLTECPECSAQALKKMVSAPNFRLKGGGWYETDFKTDKDKKRNLADDGKSGDSKGNKSDKKAEAKPDKAKAADSTSKKSSGDGGKAA